MRRFLMIMVVLCAAASPAFAGGQANSPESSVETVAKQTRKSLFVGSHVLSLARGIMAVRGHQRHVTPKYAERLAREAREVVAQKGNEWMEPHVLLGMAVTESDLKWWLKSGHGSKADCGLTQVNITRLRMTPGKKRRLCRRMCKSTKLSMQWTMIELNEIRRKYCNGRWLARLRRFNRYTKYAKLTKRQQFLRCVLNVYNQGPRFLMYMYHRCNFHYRTAEDISPGFQATKRRRCESRNRYWIRTLCFSRGIREKKMPKRRVGRIIRKTSCRYAYSLAWVDQVYSY